MLNEMKLGRLPSPPDTRNLKLASYLRRPVLPTAPAKVNYSPAVESGGGYGMLGNDRLGCCVVSAMLHLAMQQAANDGHSLTMPSLLDVVKAYSAISGYKPGHPETDRGCNMAAALKYWRKTGITVDGAYHQIGAYAKVDLDDQAEVAAALWLFGGLFTGYNLPIAVQGVDSWTGVPRKLTRIWKPGTWGGHAVIQSDNEGSGLMKTVTWGQLVATDWKFFTTYCDEAWVVVSNDWLGSDDKCPAGFNREALLRDLEALG